MFNLYVLVLYCDDPKLMPINRNYKMEDPPSLLLKMGGSTMTTSSTIRVLKTDYHKQGKSFPFTFIPIRLGNCYL